MKKIMFNDRYGLTRAVLEGRKTQTRRLVPKRYLGEFPNEVDLFEATCNGHAFMKGEVVAVAQNLKDMGYNARDTKTISGAIWGLDHTEAWTNKMFVCASMCVHHILITNVRVERLKDISEEDCFKEGIYWEYGDYPYMATKMYKYDEKDEFTRPRGAFASLIDKVNGKGTWASNPYVYVYEFVLIK